MWWLFLAVFASSALIDACNVSYVRAVGSGEALKAATWSVLQWGVSLVGFLLVLKVDLILLLPEALGLFVGCFFAVRRYRKP